MKEELVFYEQQNFKKWKAAIFFAIIALPFIIGCIIQVGFGKQWGNNPLPDIALLIITLILVLFGLIFFFVRLSTVIDRDGIYIQMFPMQWKYKFIPWDSIIKAEVRKTSLFMGDIGFLPIYKYSFYMFGVYGFSKKNIIAKISGNIVLQLDLVNREKIVIGTQSPEELMEFLEKLDAERK